MRVKIFPLARLNAAGEMFQPGVENNPELQCCAQMRAFIIGEITTCFGLQGEDVFMTSEQPKPVESAQQRSKTLFVGIESVGKRRGWRRAISESFADAKFNRADQRAGHGEAPHHFHYAAGQKACARCRPFGGILWDNIKPQLGLLAGMPSGRSWL